MSTRFFRFARETRAWKAVSGERGVRNFYGLVKIMCALHLFSEYVGGIRTVCGPSMLPTMSATNEWILEDALTVRFDLKPISRGELVVLVSPRAPTEHICKRVIGLPGDIVCVDPTGERAPSTEHCLIPKGHIWIQGDNAAGSRDSRYYGPVPIALVRARVVARVRSVLEDMDSFLWECAVLAMEFSDYLWEQCHSSR